MLAVSGEIEAMIGTTQKSTIGRHGNVIFNLLVIIIW